METKLEPCTHDSSTMPACAGWSAEAERTREGLRVGPPIGTDTPRGTNSPNRGRAAARAPREASRAGEVPAATTREAEKADAADIRLDSTLLRAQLNG